MNASTILREALDEIGDRTAIIQCKSISGGDINSAYYVRSERHSYFAKINNHIPPRFFQSEAAGLELLRKTNVVQVPNVYYVMEAGDGTYGLLLLEWIEGEKTEQTAVLLGQAVAHLHQCYSQHFGLEKDNYIGLLSQKNRLYEDWIDYFVDCRLLPQIQLAEQKGRMPTYRRDKIEKLLVLLEQWLPRTCRPSLLHGDLWGGNWIVGTNGIPYLIDPSVFYGHYEFEIAFTELFGGFPESFYRAYNEIQPLSPEYKERKELYQLFYLLVHLNLFGETYGYSVDRILERYVG
ncbi:fructosamine kinase family protein [Thermaerobacillus caldiproteolyticus]|uniref:fructosamine kinase family protein n=1 Tax=Thermaerobacillus caldiproteolyticus TaxID=247480 RepID=UPI00188AEBF9|nr:fructosamine kinase family protein [Anoxybacillus caldiproteolyticus]QPA32313.1 fructosamine kinase family protein [Anoxybacillus caldiproteolyticus]